MTLDYAESTKYPAQIEWTLIEGVNDSAREVECLAELIKGRYAMVNFIAVNPVEGTGFKRPSNAGSHHNFAPSGDHRYDKGQCGAGY